MTSILARSALGVSLSLALSFAAGCSVEATPEEDTAAAQQGMSVINSSKCPERIKGQGAGNYVGGVCMYPKPAGGCKVLGDDCRDAYPNLECRCDAKTLSGGGGLPPIGETLPAF